MESKRGLGKIIERRKALFAKKPEAAAYTPKAVTEWKGGLLNENRIRDFTVSSDYPVPSGGSDTAPNPMELVLAALGSCVSAVYVEYAAEMGLRLDGVSVETEGDIDLRGLFNVAEVAPGYQRVSYKVTLKTNEPRGKVDELIALAESHCPVSDSLKNKVAVDRSVDVVSA